MAHLKPMPHSPSSSLFVCPADKPSMRAGDSTHKSSHLTRQAYQVSPSSLCLYAEAMSWGFLISLWLV